MSETEDQSPFGRGFIAACIVITAILACGGVLLFTGASSDTTGNPTCTPNASSPDEASSTSGSSTCRAGAQAGGAVGGGSADGDGSPSAASSGQPGADPGVAQPAGEAVARPGGSTSGSGTANRCGLPDGDQSTPSNQPPKADGWEVSRRVVVPRSSAYGPVKTDSDGFRRCFAHSPTGAVYAAYNVIAALADQSKIIPTVTKLMAPGRDTDLLLQEMRKETADEASTPVQIAGYRVVDADRDRVTIMLAMPVQTEFMSATFTLTWQAGDWRLVPPPDAGTVGTPYSQHHNLNDFVAWSGV